MHRHLELADVAMITCFVFFIRGVFWLLAGDTIAGIMAMFFGLTGLFMAREIRSKHEQALEDERAHPKHAGDAP